MPRSAVNAPLIRDGQRAARGSASTAPEPAPAISAPMAPKAAGPAWATRQPCHERPDCSIPAATGRQPIIWSIRSRATTAYVRSCCWVSRRRCLRTELAEAQVEALLTEVADTGQRLHWPVGSRQAVDHGPVALTPGCEKSTAKLIKRLASRATNWALTCGNVVRPKGFEPLTF
jgi:hypothetical protein